ncbi:hypothetical protein GCM10010124_37150 [Pilimelia terevasa]|uniref:Uncharacterized protein n=1 Tax=Pilimelia terevasa TaxID=53372 RepID=A0A8J3BTS0_9ACTN|nr:DUF4360 domain-containing protein [Pilimelia terevasa]GGK40877.1 hypothetical protein GCM10010124_37150 [Pilimelia terevasa]
MNRRTRNGLATVGASVAVAALLTGCGTASAQTLDATDSARAAAAAQALLNAAKAPTVKLLGANGEGCPNTKSIAVTNLKSGFFTIRFTKLSARVGPKVNAKERRRACTVSLRVSTDQGLTYGIKSVRVDGVAGVAKGARAQADVTAAGQPAVTGAFTKALKGPVKGAYSGTGSLAPPVRGDCGAPTRALTLTSAVATNRGSSSAKATTTLNLMPSKTKAGLTVKLVNLVC